MCFINYIIITQEALEFVLFVYMNSCSRITNEVVGTFLLVQTCTGDTQCSNCSLAYKQAKIRILQHAFKL